MNRTILLLPLFVGSCAHAPAGPSSPATSVADPAFLAQYAATYRFRNGRPTSIRVTRDGSTVLFLRSEPRSFERSLYAYDVAGGEERVLLTAEMVLEGAGEELSAEEKARRERQRLVARGIASYDLSNDGERILVPLSGRLFVVERASGAVRELKSDAGYPIDPQFSPDGAKVACVRDGDVYVIDVASGRETRLTQRSRDTLAYGAAEFVAQEEMRRHHGTWWSPDGRRLVVQETDTANVETLFIADPAHPEKPPAASAYPRAGKSNAVVRLGIVDVSNGSTVWVKRNRDSYPYLANVKWQENGPLTLVVQNREQTAATILAVDLRDGRTRSLWVETDDAWLNIDPKMPHWLPGEHGFLWMTERNGGRQIEQRAVDGKLLRPLTQPPLGLRELLDVDDEAGELLLLASREPTERHIVRVKLRGPETRPRRLTETPGVHDAVVSPGHEVYVQTAVDAEGGMRWLVRQRDGETVGELRSVAEAPPFVPQVELTTVGERALRAAVIRPRNFEISRQYPVIVYVYGGPNWPVVYNTPSRYLLQQWIADHGFIVVSIDGRGTPNRGRAWERAIKGNLIELPLRDQVDGLRALVATYPELDLTRVGIYGWSFGGYFSAMAVMQRGDVFHAAVAGAPVADWQDYDTHYTERYLGLPSANAEGYADSSVLTHASKLERPLLIIHGTADDNVYFTHAIKMSDALFRAGKPHEFLPLSNFTHMVPEPQVTTRLYQRIVGFFRGHLM